MRLHEFLSVVIFLAVWTVQCDGGSVIPEQAPVTKLDDVPITLAGRSSGNYNTEAKSLLRGQDTQETEDSDEVVSKNEEERVESVLPTSFTDFLVKAATKFKNAGVERYWSYFDFHPSYIKEQYKIEGIDNKHYFRYAKYFYNYYVRHIDEPISHFPEKVVDDIWTARLLAWVDTLTPPQVWEKIGKKKPEYYERFLDMWTKRQQEKSEPLRVMSPGVSELERVILI